MGEKKKQHFVPRFYLKNFSWNSDRKSIGVLAIGSQTYVQRASLKNQACQDDFYGEDATIENAFAILETAAADIISRMISSRTVPKEGSKEHLHLLTFVVSLAMRTRLQADAVNEGADKLFKTVYGNDPRIKGRLGQFTIRSRNASALALGELERAVVVSMDLGYKLLTNDTCHKFLTSDNPVVKHNQFLRNRVPVGSHVGFSCKGLQMLLSTDPRTCLIFFDKDVYRVGNKKEYSVAISNLDDVDEINRFQCINADKALYFNHEVSRTYVQRILKESQGLRPRSKVVVREYVGLNPEPGQRENLISVCPSVVGKDLTLSLVRIVKKAKRYVVGGATTHLRDPKLTQRLLEQREGSALADYVADEDV